MRHAVLLFASLFTLGLAAQPVTVGTQIVDAGGTSTISSGAPVSYINLSNFAPVAGTVNKASVSWSTSCSNAFKIVFLRTGFSSSVAFTVVAVRGPFNAVNGRNDVTLSPPVTLNVGDLIGVVQLQTYAACGSVRTQQNPGKLGYNLITVTDISTSGTIGSSSNYGPGYDFAAFAYNSDPVRVRVLPAAGAVQGASAFFRTSLQLLNPTTSTITGTLVFHKQNQSAAPGDPSLAFTLTPQQSLSYPDVVTSLSTAGLGSLDVFTVGGALPITTARVFSDNGALGTSGFSEEGLAPGDAMDSFSRGILLIPSDLTNYRMNIGVRTLDEGATLNIYMVSASGVLRSSRTNVSYAPNYFAQGTVADFTGASSIEAGGWIFIQMNYPSRAFIYSSVIDNRTSDSTYRLADIR